MAPYNNAIVVVIAFVVFPSMVLAQTTYVVGDSNGWGQTSVDYQAWANGIYLRTGDSLEFDYEAGPHSVVLAGSIDTYNECSTHQSEGIYRSGHDVFSFPEVGWYFFFCQELCYTGMKFFIHVN